MTGFENITAFNGWSMAVTGITIVFVSLGMLSFAISRIHKILNLWDFRGEYIAKIKNSLKPSPKEETQQTRVISSGLKDCAKNFKIISSFIGEPFHLSDLIKFAEKRGLISPSPKAVVEDLLKASLIVKADEKRFCWNSSACDHLI